MGERRADRKDRKPKDPKPLVIPRNLVEVHRFAIKQMMENPSRIDRPPEQMPEVIDFTKPPEAPTFVRHVIGSSSGAGSGEFHVYRNQRKFEMLRGQWLENQVKEEKAQIDFDEKKKLLNEYEAAITAEKRAKRVRKRNNAKMRKKMKNVVNDQEDKQQEETEHNDNT